MATHTERNGHLIHQSACIKHGIGAVQSAICAVTLRPNSQPQLLFYHQTRLGPADSPAFD